MWKFSHSAAKIVLGRMMKNLRGNLLSDFYSVKSSNRCKVRNNRSYSNRNRCSVKINTNHGSIETMLHAHSAATGGLKIIKISIAAMHLLDTNSSTERGNTFF